MKREDKVKAIAELSEKFENYDNFYLTDSSTLTVEEVNNLRRKLFEAGIEMRVVKNTLAQKALERGAEERKYAELKEHLKGPTAIMFTPVANAPAKIIEEFRKKKERPLLKAAYIDTSIFVGDDALKELAALKSKEELIGEIISLLGSPIQNVIGALDSAGSSLAGILQTLSEKGE